MSDEKQPTRESAIADAFAGAIRAMADLSKPTTNPLQPACCRRMVEDGWRFEWDSVWFMVSAVRGEKLHVLFTGTQPQALHDILSTPEQNEIGTAIARMLNGE